MGIAMTFARVPGPGDTSGDYGRYPTVAMGLETRIMAQVKEGLIWGLIIILGVVFIGTPIVFLGDWLIGNVLFPFSGMIFGAYVAYFIYLLIDKLFLHEISFYPLGYQIFGSVIGIVLGAIGYRLGGYPLLPVIGLFLGSFVGYSIYVFRDKNNRNKIK